MSDLAESRSFTFIVQHRANTRFKRFNKSTWLRSHYGIYCPLPSEVWFLVPVRYSNIRKYRRSLTNEQSSPLHLYKFVSTSIALLLSVIDRRFCNGSKEEKKASWPPLLGSVENGRTWLNVKSNIPVKFSHYLVSRSTHLFGYPEFFRENKNFNRGIKVASDTERAKIYRREVGFCRWRAGAGGCGREQQVECEKKGRTKYSSAQRIQK